MTYHDMTIPSWYTMFDHGTSGFFATHLKACFQGCSWSRNRESTSKLASCHFWCWIYLRHQVMRDRQGAIHGRIGFRVTSFRCGKDRAWLFVGNEDCRVYVMLSGPGFDFESHVVHKRNKPFWLKMMWHLNWSLPIINQPMNWYINAIMWNAYYIDDKPP